MRSSAKLRRALWIFGFCALTTGQCRWIFGFLQPSMPRRGLLGALVGAAGAAPAVAETSGIDICFGQGCFWHVQRDMVQLESQLLARTSGNEVTSITGYAGGLPTQGKKQQVCYHNLDFPLRDYSRLGHAEAVKVAQVPENQVAAFAKAYLDSVVSEQPAGRPDAQDVGAEYRAMIGLPGGANSSVFPDIVAANAGRLKLAVAQGSDPDTADTQVVWIYDSEQFPFYQAELYHQFHDDIGAKYPASYKSLKDGLLKKGRLRPVSCPEEEFSEEQSEMADDPINFGAAGPDPFDKVIGIFKDPNPPVPKKTGKKRFEQRADT
mmetsp:Transcript_68769/g.139415  ORF Transcript_68769/g.139415 Transcript_68769/m.139415 type:complete len:321 (+) Transcript_68769:84-1046(+)